MSKPNFQEKVELLDGSEILLRPIEPEDATRLQDLFSRLSQESIYMRFLEFRKELSLKEAQRFADVDYQGNMAIVAALPTAGDLIGVARYGETIPPRPGVVDAAVVVQDEYQGRGLGTILLLRLVEYAREHGIEAMHATVHQSNAQIMRFITKSGLPSERKLSGGVWDITVSLADLGNLPSH